jgi:hypothetical protein
MDAAERSPRRPTVAVRGISDMSRAYLGQVNVLLTFLTRPRIVLSGPVPLRI